LKEVERCNGFAGGTDCEKAGGRAAVCRGCWCCLEVTGFGVCGVRVDVRAESWWAEKLVCNTEF